MLENLAGYIAVTVTIVSFFAILVWYFRRNYGRTNSVKATVVHKQTVETFSKYSGNGKHTRYAVTFSVNGKNRSFYVSAFSYNGYKIGETGALTYKGDRLISFI